MTKAPIRIMIFRIGGFVRITVKVEVGVGGGWGLWGSVEFCPQRAAVLKKIAICPEIYYISYIGGLLCRHL
jgi:hypothetical protein